MPEFERERNPDTSMSPATERSGRGLSRRLRRPLSLEANVEDAALDDDQDAEEEVVAKNRDARPLDQELEDTGAQAAGLSRPREVRGRGDQLETRQVAGKKSSDTSGEAGQEGLLSVGTQLQRRYKILGVIGVGGMGAVYKAQDLRFPGVTRLCAVKEMINTASDPQVRQMIVRNFEREASILATLSHPAIPQVYDYFTDGSRSYLVEEFIAGKDLEARIAELEGFFSEKLVIDWAVQLCDVLSFLHNHEPRPIIFRDLKPSNVMLDLHGRIRLVDFGIAKLFQSGQKGTMIGTEGYSPPEQYRGVAEPRGDVYALGATMHHLLSKQDPRLEPPFSFNERPVHMTNPTVSRELVEVIDRALAYDVNERWGSAEELRRALLAAPAARGITGHLRTDESTTMLTDGTIKPIWRFACEDEVRGSVALAEDVVLVPSYDHNVYALDADEGNFLWKYAAEGGVAASPCVSDGLVVFGSTDRTVYAVDLDAGELQWTAATKGRIYSSAWAQFGHFFVGSDDGSLYALHATSGRKAWTYASDSEIRSRPFVDDHLIIFSCHAGMVYALSLARELRWRFRARRGILAAPVLRDGLVFVGSLDWTFYALDSRSGWAAWKYRTGGPVASTSAVYDDLVIFGSADGYIYALQASDGRLVWRYQTDGQVTGSAAVHEGAVYVGGVDGVLYCLDAQSGVLRWRYQTEGAITGAPQVADGIVYFGSGDHYVYALPA
jgi:eukaryotic-like serine/threonine-protein kinase